MHIKKRHIPEALEQAALLFEQGALQQAGAILAAIVKADPRQAEALHLLGLLEGRQGQLETAENHIRMALKFAPENAEYYNSLGVTLRKRGKLPEAERCYRRALKLQPEHIEALDNLATLLRREKRATEAESFCRRAVRLSGSSGRHLVNLAGCLAEQGKIGEVKRLLDGLPENFDKTLRANALVTLMAIAQSIGDAAENTRLHRQILTQCDPDFDLGAYLFYLNYLDGIDQRYLFEQHCQVAARMVRTITAGDRQCGRPLGNKRPLKVGYLSPDFLFGSVGSLIEPIVLGHDPEKVSCVLYDVHRQGRIPFAASQSPSLTWRASRDLSDDALAQLIEDDALDILVDLAGYCADTRIRVLARRLAPVQVSWLGYFNTTGMKQVDWLISDCYSTPPDEDSFYSERICRLPHFRFSVCLKGALCSDYSAPEPGSVAFVSYNNVLKLTPAVLAAWVAILARLPRAKLRVCWKSFIFDEVRTAFGERFRGAGGDMRQLELMEPCEEDKLLASYADSDIMLDSFPFSGGITSLDALGMGVPVVTLAGDRMAGRQTQAFLELAGHPELVARSVDDYIRIAVELANDPARLAQLRACLRDDLLCSPLCDVTQFTRDLEAAYRGIWEDWYRSGTGRPTAG